MELAIVIAALTGLAVLIGLAFIAIQVRELICAQRRRVEIEREMAQHRRAAQWASRYDDQSGVRTSSNPPPPKQEAA